MTAIAMNYLAFGLVCLLILMVIFDYRAVGTKKIDSSEDTHQVRVLLEGVDVGLPVFAKAFGLGLWVYNWQLPAGGIVSVVGAYGNDLGAFDVPVGGLLKMTLRHQDRVVVTELEMIHSDWAGCATRTI